MDLMATTRHTCNPWSTPTNLGTVVNSTARDDAPAISSDGLTLYFATKRSSGTLDLWQAARSSPMSDWDTPTSLGRTVNSSSDDHGVSISQDGLTLYFASGRAGSSGGDDLWQTTLPHTCNPLVHANKPRPGCQQCL